MHHYAPYTGHPVPGIIYIRATSLLEKCRDPSEKQNIDFRKHSLRINLAEILLQRTVSPTLYILYIALVFFAEMIDFSVPAPWTDNRLTSNELDA